MANFSLPTVGLRFSSLSLVFLGGRSKSDQIGFSVWLAAPCAAQSGTNLAGRSIGSGPRWPIGAPGGFLMPGCPDAWIARMAKIARMAELDCPDARMAKIARIPMASGHGQQPWPVAMATGHGQRPWPAAMASGHGQRPWPVAMASGHGHSRVDSPGYSCNARMARGCPDARISRLFPDARMHANARVPG